MTLETEVPAEAIGPFREKLKRIVEVYAVTVYSAGQGLKKTGFYRLSAAALTANLWGLMAKYGPALSSMGEKSLVICKTGSDQDLSELYDLLEGPHCSAFVKAV